MCLGTWCGRESLPTFNIILHKRGFWNWRTTIFKLSQRENGAEQRASSQRGKELSQCLARLPACYFAFIFLVLWLCVQVLSKYRNRRMLSRINSIRRLCVQPLSHIQTRLDSFSHVAFVKSQHHSAWKDYNPFVAYTARVSLVKRGKRSLSSLMHD